MLVDTAAEHHRPQGVADPGMGGTNGVVGWKKVGGAESRNFRSEATNFRRDSDRELQISARGDYGCSSKFQFCFYVFSK